MVGKAFFISMVFLLAPVGAMLNSTMAGPNPDIVSESSNRVLVSQALGEWTMYDNHEHYFWAAGVAVLELEYDSGYKGDWIFSDVIGTIECTKGTATFDPVVGNVLAQTAGAAAPLKSSVEEGTCSLEFVDFIPTTNNCVFDLFFRGTTTEIRLDVRMWGICIPFH